MSIEKIDDGAALDIADDVDIQFTKKNILFSFDDIEVERTTEFEIPATPHNNALLGLANDEHFDGEKARRKFTIQLQASGVVKDGYLYITSVEKGYYKVVFVTGELLGLKEVKELGKLSDICKRTDVYVMYPDDDVIDAHNAPEEVLYKVRYFADKSAPSALLPSFNLTTVLQWCLPSYVRIIPPTGDQYRIIFEPEDMKVRKQTFKRKIIGEPTTTASEIADIDDIWVSRESDFYHEFRWREERTYYTAGGGIDHKEYFYVNEFSCEYDVNITFPDDFPDDVFVGQFTNDEYVQALRYFRHFGDYSLITFDRDSEGHVTFTTSGEPLAGRTITIPKNTPFLFISLDDVDTEEIETPEGVTPSFHYVTPRAHNGDVQFDIDCQHQFTNFEDDEERPIFLTDNLPDLTITDVAKMFGATSGKLMYYDYAEDTIKYDDADVANWDVLDVTDDAIERGELVRSFASFARDNNVEFDTADNVLSTDKIVKSYNIDNDTIDEKKTLFKIPFSEGSQRIWTDENGVTWNCFYDRNKVTEAKKMSIAIANEESGDYMERVEVTLNDTIKQICDRSTSLTLKFRCSFLRFDTITERTIIMYRNAKYVWTELAYSDDVVSAKLAQIHI